jgi:putative two-component system response regulator
VTHELILIVEDEEEIASSLCEWLRMVSYRTHVAHDGAIALDELARIQPDIIISDISMPELDGYQFYEAVRAHPEWTTIPFLFLTARAERNDVLAAKGLGADDYIIKPWSPDELLLAIQAKLKRAQEVNFAQLRRAYRDSLIVLAAAIEARDPHTRSHVERVAEYALLLGRELGLNDHQLAELEFSAILHDIGKISVPEAILLKTDTLDKNEMAEMRRHPDVGAAMVKDIPYLLPAIPGIKHHHERYDGKGYPDGLAGEAIPLAARILAVADALDAMTTRRPYKPPRSLEDALVVMRAESGRQFDPKVVAALERIMERTQPDSGP